MKDRLEEFRDEFVGNYFVQYDDDDIHYDPQDNKDRELIEDFMVFVHQGKQLIQSLIQSNITLKQVTEEYIRESKVQPQE